MDSENKPSTDLHVNARMRRRLNTTYRSSVGWDGMTFLQLHEPPPVIQWNPISSLTHSGSGTASSDRTQVWSKLQRVSFTLPCFCPQPSWGGDALRPGESRDSKKWRIWCKRRRRILSVLLFLSGKKKTLLSKGQRAKVQSNCRFESHLILGFHKHGHS